MGHGCAHHRHTVPVTMGSPSFRSVELDGLRVTDATFAPSDVLPAHSHDCTILAVMLEGGFDLQFPWRSYECPAGTVVVEPAGERHANQIGKNGARVLVLELPPGALADANGHGKMLDAPSARSRRDIHALAQRLSRKCTTDGVDPGLIESMSWELIEAATRPADERVRGRSSAWLEAIREQLHASLDRPVVLNRLAREAGVHRVHLGRVFRERFGESLGDYHRRLRLEWAATMLGDETLSIGEIAHRSGFADQAHFTRHFKRRMGQTPDRYRRSLSKDPGSFP